MNKKIFFILSALMLCLCFALSACSPDDSGTGGGTGGNGGGDDNNGTYYTVTFDSHGGSTVESQRILESNPVRAPQAPTRDDDVFQGWYKSTDENAQQWNFSTDRVNSDITLHAFWKETQTNHEPTDTLVYERNLAGTGYIVTGDSGQNTVITIPAEHENLPVIGIKESAFAYSKHTSDIFSVTIPDSVVEIEKNAFYSRHELTTVVIGENSQLTTIGNNAFSGCRALTSIYLPAGVSSIGDSALNNCGALNSITVASENTVYSSEGNNLIDIATHTLIRGSNQSVIPSTVTTIGDAAFRRAQLTTLTIPATVKTIGKYVIQNSLITTVIFAGTTAEWEAVNKPDSWNMGKRDVAIKCSDTVQTSKILVAYFSCTNTTKGVAEAIHSQVSNSDIYEITPAVPYTSADLNYNSDCRANREQNDPTARPVISGSVDNIEQYDVIFIGYPIWWGQAPKIIYTFFESYDYDFDGVTIIPFCTSGSSGIGSSATNLHDLAPKANWKSGARISGNNVSSLIAQMD